MTADNVSDLDTISDELIEIFVDHKRTNVERTRASQQLYQRHTSWVVQQIGRKVYNPDDIQDVAQTVWMLVLQPEKLKTGYKNKNGKFRAYLRAPIRWAILKHIDKLPFTVDETGAKASAHYVDISESMLEESLDSSMLERVIEHIIKPNLKSVELKSRNVYVVNEYDTIFETEPSLAEVAAINGIDTTDASRIFDNAGSKPTDTCTNEEISVCLPMNYKSIVDPALLQKSSGRYLAGLIGISEAAFRKRLHGARKYLLEVVKRDLFLTAEGSNHG